LVDIYGLRFHDLVGSDQSANYLVVYSGDVSLGVVRTSVHAGDINEVREIAGPCGGFEISGTVYMDADSNGVQSAEELGLPQVTVRLDDGGRLLTASTDATGAYSFLKLAGTYTVRIDPSTPEQDINEKLADSFEPTGATSRAVTVGPISTGNDFGYHPQQQKIIDDLETGTLQTDGRNVKFWTKQVRAAMSKNTSRGEFTPSEMMGFISEIEDLFLLEPYQFSFGSELQEALDILSIQSQDPLQQLRRELLAAEFNEVSGKGLLGQTEIQHALLKWAEALIARSGAAASAQPVQSWSGGPQAATGSGLVADAVKILELLNGGSSTGGGSGGGG